MYHNSGSFELENFVRVINTIFAVMDGLRIYIVYNYTLMSMRLIFVPLFFVAG